MTGGLEIGSYEMVDSSLDAGVAGLPEVSAEAQAEVAAEQAEAASIAREGVALQVAEALQADEDMDAQLAELGEVTGFDVAQVSESVETSVKTASDVESAAIEEGSFTATETREYDNLRSEVMNLEEGDDTEDLALRISESGLDQEAVDELERGLTQFAAGEAVDILTGHDLDVHIDGTVEETEDIGELFRDTLTNVVDWATTASSNAVNIAEELFRAISTGNFDSDRIIDSFMAILGQENESAEQQDQEFEANVRTSPDMKLSDLLPALDPETEFFATKVAGSNEIYFDLSAAESRGDLPSEIRMVIPEEQATSREYNGDSFEAGEVLYDPYFEGGGLVSLQYQDISGEWVPLSDAMIGDGFEYHEEEEESDQDEAETASS